MMMLVLSTFLLATFAFFLLNAPWRSSVCSCLSTTLLYLRAFLFFLRGGAFDSCPYFLGGDQLTLQAKAQTYSLALIFYLYDKPHYRSGTFGNDMVKNLRNVAVPGTGLPLSWVAKFKPLLFCFVLFGIPLVCVVAALRLAMEPEDRVTHPGLVWPTAEKFAVKFYECLLTPKDWHSYWRLNCRLASFHALVSRDATASDFALEDKWEFLTRAEEENVPVSPFLRTPGLVCKHRNEEGGLGYSSFSNASVGGDWIIQERLSNGKALADLLPQNAPLSTLRVITASTAGLPVHLRDVQPSVKTAASTTTTTGTTTTTAAAAAATVTTAALKKDSTYESESDSPVSVLHLPLAVAKLPSSRLPRETLLSEMDSDSLSHHGEEDEEEDEEEYASEFDADDDDDLRVLTEISPNEDADEREEEEEDSMSAISALSCVFRAGREGALTDHVNILFDVDNQTGVVREGTTNQHWYNLGLWKALKTAWVSTHDVKEHPDVPGGDIVGSTLPIDEIISVARKGHASLCPGVPLVGWDVAITKEHGMLLLEGNFSCNFFRGEFDELKYFRFVNRYFSYCDNQRRVLEEN
jgi:hypothetical protein